MVGEIGPDPSASMNQDLNESTKPMLLRQMQRQEDGKASDEGVDRMFVG